MTEHIIRAQLRLYSQGQSEDETVRNILYPNADLGEFERFEAWIKSECPYCSNPKNLKQLSGEEFFKLREKYTSKLIADTVMNLENRKDLRKRYSNLYRTLLNWIK